MSRSVSFNEANALVHGLSTVVVKAIDDYWKSQGEDPAPDVTAAVCATIAADALYCATDVATALHIGKVISATFAARRERAYFGDKS